MIFKIFVTKDWIQDFFTFLVEIVFLDCKVHAVVLICYERQGFVILFVSVHQQLLCSSSKSISKKEFIFSWKKNLFKKPKNINDFHDLLKSFKN